MRLDLRHVCAGHGNMKYVDPSAWIEVHGHDWIPSSDASGESVAKLTHWPGVIATSAHTQSLMIAGVFKPASWQFVQLHGRVATVVRTIRIGDCSRAGEPATVREPATIPGPRDQPMMRRRGLGRDVHAREVGD